VLETKRQYNAGWSTSVDLQNLVTASEALTHGAPDRRESRAPTPASKPQGRGSCGDRLQTPIVLSAARPTRSSGVRSRAGRRFAGLNSPPV